MKKWKQLVVFVMILTMVMGMTSFAAGDSGVTSGARSAGVPRATDTAPGDEVEDPSNLNGSATGKIELNEKPEAVPTSVDTAIVNGKEERVELKVQSFAEATAGMSLKDKEEITESLKSQAAKLTGFGSGAVKETKLFDVDLVLKGSSTSVGDKLSQKVAVSLNCSSMGFPRGTTKDHLRVLHYNVAKKAWENKPIISYENGIVTAEFESLSPVALLRSDTPVKDPDAVVEPGKDPSEDPSKEPSEDPGTTVTVPASTGGAWNLTASVRSNKYNTIYVDWNKIGSGKAKYVLGIFESSTAANPFKTVVTKKGSYKFNKAECGKTYFFRVKVEGSSVWSPVCCNETYLTGTPKLTFVKSTYDTITLKISKVRGAKYYDIYNAITDLKVATVKGGKCTIKGVETGVENQYYVVARRDAWRRSSDAISAKAELKAVTGVKVRGLDSATAKVTWKRVKGATSYIVQRWYDGYEGEPGEYYTINDGKPVTTNFFVDSDTWVSEDGKTYTDGLAPNTTYKYRIIPVRSGKQFVEKAGIGQGKTKNLPK